MKSWSLKIATSDYDDDDHDDDDDDDHNDDDHHHHHHQSNYDYDDYYYSLIIIVVVVVIVVVCDQKMILAKILKMCQMSPTIGSSFQETAAVNDIVEMKGILLALILCIDLCNSYIYGI